MPMQCVCTVFGSCVGSCNRYLPQDTKLFHPEMPEWLSGWASAFSSGCDPGVLGSSPTSGSPQEPASPPACVSATLSLCLSWINKNNKNLYKKTYSIYTNVPSCYFFIFTFTPHHISVFHHFIFAISRLLYKYHIIIQHIIFWDLVFITEH